MKESGCADLNRGPRAPKARALNQAELHPVSYSILAKYKIYLQKSSINERDSGNSEPGFIP